jgi:hypothetical protein
MWLRIGREQQVGQRPPYDGALVNGEQLLRLVRDRDDREVGVDDEERVRRSRRDLGDRLEQQPESALHARALQPGRLLTR